MTPDRIALRPFAIAAGIGLGAAGATLIAAKTGDLWWTLAFLTPVLALPVVWWLLSGSANRWVGGFLGAALLLPPLPGIALGNTGPHPALLFAAAGGWIGVLRLREWRFRLNPVSGAMLVFLLALLASLAPAAVYAGGEVAAASLARVLLFGIAVYVYLYSAHGPGFVERFDPLRSIRWLLAAAMLMAAFACLDFYFQFPAPAGYGAQFVWLDVGILRRAQGLFYEASTLGNCCAFFLVMIATAAAMRARVSKWALAGTGAMLSAALLFSYSRASILALGCALFALLCLRRGHGRLGRWLLLSPLMLLAGAAVAYFAFPEFARSYLIRAGASFEFFFAEPNRVLSGRLLNWQIAGGLLLEHPLYLLLGTGYKTLPHSDLAGGAPLVVDNMYLSLLIETGIPGLLAFLWLNLQIMRKAYRAARMESLFGTWIFCFWVGELVQMLSGDLFTYWRVLPLYFWVLAQADERPIY